MKSSTLSCFYLADAVALTRSNDRLSQAAPTYPQSHAPSTFLQSCHKEDYVTVGSTQAISPTVTTLSLFPPVSCSGLKLFVKVSVFSTFSDLRCLPFSFDFFPFSLKSFISAGRNFLPRSRGRSGFYPAADKNALRLQLLGWGQRSKPISCSWIHSCK